MGWAGYCCETEEQIRKEEVDRMENAKRLGARVYIASPYSAGDAEENVMRQIEVANVLLNAGLCPYVPLLTHFWHARTPRDYEDWMRLDAEWLRCSDVVLRLPGESAGADREAALARELGIPVLPSVGNVLRWFDVPEQGVAHLLGQTVGEHRERRRGRAEKSEDAGEDEGRMSHVEKMLKIQNAQIFKLAGQLDDLMRRVEVLEVFAKPRMWPPESPPNGWSDAPGLFSGGRADPPKKWWRLW